MKFKLLLALVEESKVDPILSAARDSGATGATVITSVRGEGRVRRKTFFGLDLVGQRDIVLLVVEEHLSRRILEAVSSAGRFDEEPGSGIAIQLAIEDAVGLGEQIRLLSKRIEEEL